MANELIVIIIITIGGVFSFWALIKHINKDVRREGLNNAEQKNPIWE